MSYHVDPRSQLFDELSEAEAVDLREVCHALVLRGESCWGHPAFVAWCEALGFAGDRSLLVMATAFPQRALLSLLERRA